MRHIYDSVISPHLFESWYATLDPWNRGMIFASHLKNYLSSIGFNNLDEINRMVPDLQLEKVDEAPKLFDHLREEADSI
jgi:Ca2+-binding EF-hand superfamily protein